MKPQRKCIVCNTVQDKELLLRIVLHDGEPILDKDQKLPGRGSYVCNNQDCIDKAIKRNAFNRVYKSEISKEALGRCFNDR